MSGVDRYAAFAEVEGGGNPAGVVLDALGLTDEQMQQIAAEVGYSETAFVGARDGERIAVRYFAPEGEVAFCGHATVATAVALAGETGSGRFSFGTRIGTVAAGAEGDNGFFELAQVGHRPLPPAQLDELLAVLGWTPDDLDPSYPPGIGFSGNLHPVLVARSVDRLATLDYDFKAGQRLARDRDWITFQLIARTGGSSWRARDPSPWGGVVEDPATGSAAAAFAGYLQGLSRLAPGELLTIDQGVELGSPSRLMVTLTGHGARVGGPVRRIG